VFLPPHHVVKLQLHENFLVAPLASVGTAAWSSLTCILAIQKLLGLRMKLEQGTSLELKAVLVCSGSV